MNVRLTTLRKELITAFDQAACSRYSVEDMTDVHKFSQHFGSKDLSDSLHKYIELRQGGDQSFENTSSNRHFSGNNRVRSQEVNNHTDKSLSSETQEKYCLSPEKVAQVEMQSSTENYESYFSVDEDQQHLVERSRTLIRPSSPRGRHLQCGEGKSDGQDRVDRLQLPSSPIYFPSRERSFFPKDEVDNSEEPEKAPKTSEHNVRRMMSVQDAINLFERKQGDQREDTQKEKSVLNAKNCVVRRVSSRKWEDSSRSPRDSSVQDNVENREVRLSLPDFEEDESGVAKEYYPNETCEKDVEHPTFTTVNEKQSASAEWNRQKEEELNQLSMKMMESKPVKSRTVLPASSKRQSLPSEQRGDLYDNYKEKRDEKLKVKAAREITENQKQSKSTQQIPDVKKSKPISTTASDDSNRRKVKKIQKPQKSHVSQPENFETEKIPKLGTVKKDSPKTSLPAVRKSWSSISSARATEMSPAKTPPRTYTTTNATPTRRRSQTPPPPPPPPVSHSSSKVEKTQMRAKSNQNDGKKSLKSDSEKKQQSLTKPTKTAKSKIVQTPLKDLASSIEHKVTKKSSVVPLESKPFLKDSKTTSAENPSATKKSISSKDITPPEENVTSFTASEPVTHQEDQETEELKTDEDMKPGPIHTNPEKCEDEGFSQIIPTVDEAVEPELMPEVEYEFTISPRAWVEIEENEDHLVTYVDHNREEVGSSEYIYPVEASSPPRVHHSLSQMLLKETDFVEWGNAENVYQKDAPKGFKRLLKFARKSKHEANITGLSNPTIFSEAQANISKLNGQSSSQHSHQGQISASVTSTKASRSFFSFSAFKGSK